MLEIKNTVSSLSIAIILDGIRRMDLFSDADHQNTALMHRQLASATGASWLNGFREQWEHPESIKVPQLNGVDQLDKDLSQQMETCEILYILVFTNLISLNVQRDTDVSNKNKNTFLQDVSKQAFDTVRNALFAVYEEDDEIPSVDCAQVQKLISVLVSDIRTRKALQSFITLNNLDGETVASDQLNGVYEVLDLADTIQFWGLELDQNFADAFEMYHGGVKEQPPHSLNTIQAFNLYNINKHDDLAQTMSSFKSGVPKAITGLYKQVTEYLKDDEANEINEILMLSTEQEYTLLTEYLRQTHSDLQDFADTLDALKFLADTFQMSLDEYTLIECVEGEEGTNIDLKIWGVHYTGQYRVREWDEGED